MSEQLVSQLAWLVENSDGVKGLRLDGEIMPWAEVLELYCPDVADQLDLCPKVRDRVRHLSCS